MSQTMTALAELSSVCPWVIVTPLARPVVPLVYRMQSRSVSGTSMPGSSSDAPSATAWYAANPGRSPGSVDSHSRTDGNRSLIASTDSRYGPSTPAADAPQSARIAPRDAVAAAHARRGEPVGEAVDAGVELPVRHLPPEVDHRERVRRGRGVTPQLLTVVESHARSPPGAPVGVGQAAGRPIASRAIATASSTG